MSVSLEKEKAMRDRMDRLGISESDFQETFIRSSGPGGQKVNKTSSCVYLVHLPTGLSIKCQRERSQALNRYLARRLLIDRIERQRLGILAEERTHRERIRRQKRRRSKRAQERILILKHRQAEKKLLRGKIHPEGAGE